MIIELEYDPETPANVTIVDELSALEGTDGSPDELGFALYEYVDPETHDRIVTGGAGDVAVSVSIDEYRVTVSNDGRIRIRTRE